MCSSKEVSDSISSIQKDMSLAEFEYVRCGECASFYLQDVTRDDLDAYYSSQDVYESTTSKERFVEELAKTLQITSKEHVVDLGCGSGAWALPMMSHCGRMTCVDISKSNLDRLQELVPLAYESRLECHQEYSLDFLRRCPDQAFDLVLSMFSLEHDASPQHTAAEMRRVLKPNGKAVVLVPSADALQVQVLGRGFYWFQAPWHTFVPSTRGLRLLATQVGFSSLRTFATKQPFYSWFWVRGLCDSLRLRNFYDKLRKYNWFVKCDIAVDELVDRYSFRIRRPSYGFYILSR